MNRLAILLLAAGASRRMRGRDKLLEPVGSEVLLRERARACLAAGARDVLVVVPGDTARRRATLEELGLTIVTAADAAQGMAASIRAGVAALPKDCAAVLMVLADMPDLTSTDLQAVLAAHDSAAPRICRAVDCEGRAGHPVLFPARLLPGLARLTGDSGARGLIAAEKGAICCVPLVGHRATTDLDTPQDWENWRRRHQL